MWDSDYKYLNGFGVSYFYTQYFKLSELEKMFCKIQRKPVENLMKIQKNRQTFPTPTPENKNFKSDALSSVHTLLEGVKLSSDIELELCSGETPGD